MTYPQGYFREIDIEKKNEVFRAKRKWERTAAPSLIAAGA
jgi:hypothetical protein